MKQIDITFLEFASVQPDLDEVSVRLCSLGEKNRIDVVNWEKFPYKPLVTFTPGYTARELLIRFDVTEENFRAEKTRTNDNVFEDSCVEFFFSPADDGIYYNLEFNGIGTCLVGMGASRSDRIRIDPVIAETIRRKSTAGKDPISEINGSFSWTLVAAIPWSVFYKHNTGIAEGKLFRANFYKCGDKLKIPHYLTWNPVPTEKPDFHRPEYFGAIRLGG